MERRAFTVVEMLVSIAIIGVLMGLLMPALSSVKASARGLRCQSNLRQMTLAVQSYATLWDTFPAAIRYETVDETWRRIAWDWVTTWSGELISPGALWGMTDDPHHVMQCPGYHGPSNFNGDPHTGYNYNTSFIGGEAEAVIAGWEIVRMGVPPHACQRTAGTAVFGCAGFSGGANKFMRAPEGPEAMSLSARYAGGQAFRHAGSTNVGHLDGHVSSSSQPRPGLLATPELLELVMGYPANGFLSDDESAYDPR